MHVVRIFKMRIIIAIVIKQKRLPRGAAVFYASTI